MSFLTIDQKRQVVIKHYESSGYKNEHGKPFRVDPNLSDKLVEEYYANIQKLHFSEQCLRTEKPKLKLILNPEKFKIAYPDKVEE